MTGEEIQLKVGLDASEFASGTRAASEKLEAFAHHGAQEFGRLGGAGRVVTNVLREISNSAPKVGEALTIAFGAIGIAGIAYKVLNERVDDYLKKLDEIGKKNAEPIFGEDKVHKLREDIEAIEKRLKESQQRQHLDPISGAVEAITGETDPKFQGSSARQMLKRFAADKDAANKVLVDLTEKAKLLTSQTEKIPENLAAAKRALEQANAAPVGVAPGGRFDPGLGGFVGDPTAQRRLQQEHDERVTKASMQVKAISDKQQELGHQLRVTNEQFAEQDKKVQALNKAIGELQKLLDKIDPGWTTRPLLQFQRPGSFTLSASGLGAPAGYRTVFDENSAYLKQIASCVEGGFLKAKIPNGP